MVRRQMRAGWSVLAVLSFIAGVAALFYFGPFQIWGWLFLWACWWCLKKFAEASP